MPKILVCADSFKDSFSSIEINQRLSTLLSKHAKPIDIIIRPLSDGGEGTINLIHEYTGFSLSSTSCLDPLGRQIQGQYVFDEKSSTGYIEMSQASGLQLLVEKERQAMKTSTFGTGQLIRHVLELGAKHIKLFVGGSATNDGGAGMLEALGFEFYEDEVLLSFMTGADLNRITSIRLPTERYDKQSTITVYCDVTNPLLGQNGATFTYGKQKGATAEELSHLEAGMQNYASLLNKLTVTNCTQDSGAGAAGGIAFGARAGLDARIESGVDELLSISGVRTLIDEVDWIITGEGSLDLQTEHGKLVHGVCELSKRSKANVLAIGAISSLTATSQVKLGIQNVFTLYKTPPPSINKEDSLYRLEKCVEQMVHYIEQRTHTLEHTL